MELNTKQHTKLLFQEFLLAYISNLNFGNRPLNLTEFYNNLDVMCDLNGINNKSNKSNKITKLRKYQQLFNEQYNNILIQKRSLATIRLEHKELQYLHMHGGFIDEIPRRVPDKVILVFLTPLNRYGFCKADSYLSELFTKFKDSASRGDILKNIFCLDKHIKDVSLNAVDNYKDALNNALVLYPNQSYFDLNISYDMSDTGKNSKHTFGIFKFTSDRTDVENSLSGTQIYRNSLSNYLESLKSDKFKYVFVDVCRNLDHFNQIFEKAFIYENYMYYFNTIMSNCKIAITSDLPLTHFGKLKFTHNLEKLPPILLHGFNQKFQQLFYESFPETFSEIIQEIISELNSEYSHFISNETCNPKILLDIISQKKNVELLNRLLLLNEKQDDTSELYTEYIILILQNFINHKLLDYLTVKINGYSKNTTVLSDNIAKQFSSNETGIYSYLSYLIKKLKDKLPYFILGIKQKLLNLDTTEFLPKRLATIKKTRKKSRIGHTGRNSIHNMSYYSSKIIKNNIHSLNNLNFVNPSDIMHPYVSKVYDLIKNEPFFKEVDTYIQ